MKNKVIITLFATTWIGWAGFALAQTDVLVVDGTSVGILNAEPTGPGGTNLILPVAKAIVGQKIVLDGTKNYGAGTSQKVYWKQVSGPKAELKDAESLKASFVPKASGTYVFELVATDARGNEATQQKIGLSVSSKPTETTGGTEDINIGIGEQKGESGGQNSTSSKGGNVEFEWKVEEGESGAPEETDDVREKDEEDSDDEGRANDRLINAGPKDDWPTGGISVAAGDVNGLTDDEKEERLEKVKTWAEARSGQELQNFAQGVLLRDAQVKGVKIKENLLEIESVETGKFFWLVPVQMAAKVEVIFNSSGHTLDKVKVKFPWWHIFVRKNGGAGGLESELNAELEGQQWESLNETEFEEEAARISQALNLISNILKIKHSR